MSGLDQAIIVKTKDIAEVEAIVEKAVIVGSPLIIWEYIRAQRRAGQVSALKIAAAFYLTLTKWSTETSPGIFQADDEFLDAASADTGYSRQTISKYLDVWEYAIQRAPQEHLPLLMGKDMNGLMLIATASKSGLLDKLLWRAVANAPDTSAIREALNIQRTSSAIRLEIAIDLKTGQLFRRRGQKPWREFGMINILAKDDDTIAACERIRNESHIYPR